MTYLLIVCHFQFVWNKLLLVLETYATIILEISLYPLIIIFLKYIHNYNKFYIIYFLRLKKGTIYSFDNFLSFNRYMFPYLILCFLLPRISTSLNIYYVLIFTIIVNICIARKKSQLFCSSLNSVTLFKFDFLAGYPTQN